MASKAGKDRKSCVDGATSVLDGLRTLYKAKIRPVEEKYLFAEAASPCLEDSDFNAKPFVLVLGQYSTGKTSFIEYLLKRPYPGQRIGPEPTTDRFVAVMHGADDRVTPGNALATSADLPFRGLQRFGASLLNKLEGVQCNARILESCTIIDTPGVLSGEKQRIGRAYDFPKVIEWWAERSDLILVLFDAHKLDISDELRSTIQALKGHDDKICVILNKADSVSDQQLMRVYGALMWALGKCVATPEVMRVYIGSFWDQPFKEGTNHGLFRKEMDDLMDILATLPRNASVRKTNELIKRARAAKVHALLIGHLRSQMPMFWKEAKQKELMDTMEEQFWTVQRVHGLPVGDFPDIERFKEAYKYNDFSKFPKLDNKLLQGLEDALAHDIPKVMTRFATDVSSLTITGDMPVEQIIEKLWEWDINEEDFNRSHRLFATLSPKDGIADKAKAQQMLMKSELPFETLGQIWTIADYDKDGQLDIEEFCVAMYLAHRCVDHGEPVPSILPSTLVPPSKRLQKMSHALAFHSIRQGARIDGTKPAAALADHVNDDYSPFAFNGAQ